MERTIYQVTTKHPTGYCDGMHKIEVGIREDGRRYCVADAFGYSRDYVADCNHRAVQMFLAEHACKIAKFVLPNGRELAAAVNL